MKKQDLLSVMTSTELDVIRGGEEQFETNAGSSACSKCECCGTCDAISMSGTSASKSAGLNAAEKIKDKFGL